ncbi:MAG: succinate dehydrogenase/fumarate reductase iron-sulfur subunit [Thermodesulfobacteriota bacterium]|nr:MAG: succinate dehydrogenase/fumarate reductase iron-sulfur subunit [Thermodesulfobacteriota bacterium]
MKIKVKIKRFNPTEGESPAPYMQAYNVDVTEGMTVLEALMKIFAEEDPTLGFRRSCRSAICGSCAVRVNGFSKLACNTQISPEYEKHGEVLIEPLSNYPVLKDLVVDFDKFWKKMDKITPYLTPPEDPGAVPRVTKEDAERIDSSQRCIMCGACNSECNALEIDTSFIGPSALAKSWRFVGDVREAESGKRLKRLSAEHGVWDCVRCIHCTEYCPKEVAPLTQIERLRSKAIKEGLDDNPGAKHVISMIQSVRRLGRLDEAAMTFKTLGFLRSLGMIPFGIKLEIHGKMPLPHIFSQIEGIDEVRTIFKESEKITGGKKKR